MAQTRLHITNWMCIGQVLQHDVGVFSTIVARLCLGNQWLLRPCTAMLYASVAAIRAIGVPTGTLSPSCTRISAIVPV